jgi:hypothetical protein
LTGIFDAKGFVSGKYEHAGSDEVTEGIFNLQLLHDQGKVK